MTDRTKNEKRSRFLNTIIFISAVILMFTFSSVILSVKGLSWNGIYFEIDKNPIDKVEITTDSKTSLMHSESAKLNTVVYPNNATKTITDVSYQIISGYKYASIKDDVLTINESAPIGSNIQVIAIVDNIESSNALNFTVTRTPAQKIEFTNTEDSIVLGGSLKMKTKVFPENATEKQVVYSIVSDTDFVKVSYNGMLSFVDTTIPEEDLKVIVRATSLGDPEVYSEKSLRINRPLSDAIIADFELTEVHQGHVYSFDTKNPTFESIFGDRAVQYNLNVDQNIATIDANGLLYVNLETPFNTEIIVNIDSYDGLHYEHKLIVVPIFATGFTPIIETNPTISFYGQDYYMPGDVIKFDVVSYTPVNVSNCNKVFAISVSDESIAYVDGTSVIIRDVSKIDMENPKFSVTVYSEPNGLEETFDIYVYIPVSAAIVVPEVTELRENSEYLLRDLVKYSVYPANAMIWSVDYKLDNVDKSIAEIRDNRLIVHDDLPAGEVTIGLYMEIDGIRSNTINFNVYKPTRSLELEAKVNNLPIGENNLPKSASDFSDKVILFTRVSAGASINNPNFVIQAGEQYIDGNIELCNISEDGIAQWKLQLKKNLGEVENFGRVIKIYATQDEIISQELEIEIYIPNEGLSIEPCNGVRGNNITIEPKHTTNATSKMWTLELSDQAKELGVTISENGIFIPEHLVAGTQIIINYYSVYNDAISGEKKQVIFTVNSFKDTSTNIIYSSDTSSAGFNVMYTNDNAGVAINKDARQLWVGRAADIKINYDGKLLTNYGMKLQSVNVSGPAIAQVIGNETIRVYMDSGAKGNEEVHISVGVSDGNTKYTLDCGTLKAFRPMNGVLVFDMITSNSSNIRDRINLKSSNFDLNANYGIGNLEFSILSNDNTVSMTKDGILKINSYLANNEHVIQYAFNQEYNKEITPYIETSTITIQTVALDHNGGDSDCEYIIAVSDMSDDATSLASILPSRDGYDFIGYTDSDNVKRFDEKGNCIDKNYNSTLTANWLKTYSNVSFVVNDGGHKIGEDKPYFQTVYPNFDRDSLKAYGYTHLKITITFDCREENDGYQDLYVYSYQDNLITSFTVEHGAGSKDENVWSHTVNLTTSLDNVQTDGSFYLEWNAHGTFQDDWYLCATVITMEAIR